MFGKRKQAEALAPDLRRSVVCDMGSGLVKAGLVQDGSFPRLVMPTVVGRPVVRDYANVPMHEGNSENIPDEYLMFHHPETSGAKSRFQNGEIPSHILVGKKALEKRSFLELSSPFRNGAVANWDDYELIFESVLAALFKNERSSSILTPSNRVSQEGQPELGGVVLTDSVEGSSKQQRERIAELMFEKFGFQNLNISPSAALILAARGTTTGLVVDCGYSKTEIVPVSEGFVQKGNVRRLKMGGSIVTSRFIDLLKRSDACNYRLDQDRDFFQLNQVKENQCFVALDLAEERYVADKTNLLARSFTLPDETRISVNQERFLAPEILFQPKFSGDICSDACGIPELIVDAINSSPIDLRASLFRSVILAGGTSLLENFQQRISKELSLSSHNVYVDACAERLSLAYSGGCVMGALGNPDWWLSKSQFQEEGLGALLKF